MAKAEDVADLVCKCPRRCNLCDYAPGGLRKCRAAVEGIYGCLHEVDYDIACSTPFRFAKSWATCGVT